MSGWRLRWAASGVLALGLAGAGSACAEPPPASDGAIRIATFNASLSRRDAGALVQELRTGGSAQIDAVAEIIQRVRPDVLLINEIDHDRRGRAATLFRDALREGVGGAEGIDYPHVFTEAPNTGVPTGFDLDGDGETGGPRDAFGFGYFPGQYGMAIFSRLPLVGARSFTQTRWADMPDAKLPAGFFGEAASELRLSSKAHWDIALTTPAGAALHIYASHPTPPVFDGPEDANGRRNSDEIRFWADYISGASWMVDGGGVAGGSVAEVFLVLGDLNADPRDGDADREGLNRLLGLVADPRPASAGASAAARAQGGVNPEHQGDPALDTADWRDEGGPGNLRVDYVLPSRRLEVLGSGVFWPAPESPLARLVTGGRRPASSDHRLVWVDIRDPG